MSDPFEVFLAIPTYDGTMLANGAKVAFGCPSRRRTMVLSQNGSLLTGNCNRLYAICLNERDKGFKWFAMLHADIAPEVFFLDKLIEEAEVHGADLLSVVVPIKNALRLTSTAIGSGNIYGQYGRLTMRQVQHETFPKTFDINACCDALARLPPPLGVPEAPRKYLLANTGCMIVRVDRPWAEDVKFDNRNTIIKTESGRFEARDLSEDWWFAMDVANHGGRVMCTTAVKVDHYGVFPFPNHVASDGGLANECSDREELKEHQLMALAR